MQSIGEGYVGLYPLPAFDRERVAALLRRPGEAQRCDMWVIFTMLWALMSEKKKMLDFLQ
jgi:hypothetical protein